MVDKSLVTLNRLLRTCVAVVLALNVACGSGTPSATTDDGPPVTQRPVRFRTADGHLLTGRLFGRGRVGVTLAHMFPADATSWYSAARRIARAGYATLAFNFRGYGDSEDSKQIAQAPKDIEAARDYLRRQGTRGVAFVGASMGGTASIVAAETLDPLAVVSISAPLRFMGLDAPAVANRVQRPVLLMAARDDDEAFIAVEELERALPNPDTKIYGGDAHGTNLLDDRPEAVDEIISFLHRYAPTTSEPRSSP